MFDQDDGSYCIGGELAGHWRDGCRVFVPPLYLYPPQVIPPSGALGMYSGYLFTAKEKGIKSSHVQDHLPAVLRNAYGFHLRRIPKRLVLY